LIILSKKYMIWCRNLQQCSSSSSQETMTLVWDDEMDADAGITTLFEKPYKDTLSTHTVSLFLFYTHTLWHTLSLSLSISHTPIFHLFFHLIVQVGEEGSCKKGDIVRSRNTGWEIQEDLVIYYFWPQILNSQKKYIFRL